MDDLATVHGRSYWSTGKAKEHLTRDGRYIWLFQWQGRCEACGAPFYFWAKSDVEPPRPPQNCKQHAAGRRWRVLGEPIPWLKIRQTIKGKIYWRVRYARRKMYRGQKCYEWRGRCECGLRRFNFLNPGSGRLRFD